MREFVSFATATICLVAAVCAYASPSFAEVKMHAKANTDGGLFVQLHDETTNQRMETTLTPGRTREFMAYLAKHGIVGDAKTIAPTPDAKSSGCGFGDFFSGKC